MSIPDYPILTPRLLLRPFTMADIDDLAVYRLNAELTQYIDAPLRDRSDCRKALMRMSEQVALRRPGDRISLAIERREDGALMGEVSLTWSDATAAQGELGCILNLEFAGCGYGREAMRAMLQLGFRFYRLHRIFGRCDARNDAAARALDALGMRCEAHLIEHGIFRGEWEEELIYAMLDREWNAGAGKGAHLRPVRLA